MMAMMTKTMLSASTFYVLKNKQGWEVFCLVKEFSNWHSGDSIGAAVAAQHAISSRETKCFLIYYNQPMATAWKQCSTSEGNNTSNIKTAVIATSMGNNQLSQH